MKILSCNIRCFGADDGENNWRHRKGLCIEVIRSREPDVICFQELWTQQWADLSPALPEYRAHLMADQPVGGQPDNGILYRADRYTVVSAGGYWLSETPHVPGSKSWDSACVRLATWIRLQDRATGNEFRVVNTHLDHISQPARENQARLLVEDATAYPDSYPQILTGDMNSDVRNKAIEILKAGGWVDTYGSVHGAEDPGHTFHRFLGPRFDSSIGKMDWVFIRGNIKALDAEIIRDSANGRFPSDHYFVSATVIAQGSEIEGHHME